MLPGNTTTTGAPSSPYFWAVSGIYIMVSRGPSAISIIVVKAEIQEYRGTGNCAAARVGKPGGLQRSELNGFSCPSTASKA